VTQEDFSGGVATFLVRYDAPPVVTKAAIQKEVGKYKLDKVGMKLTGKAVQKKDVWTLGNVALTGEEAAKLGEHKGKIVIVSGTLNEDEKGKQSLELASVDPLPKKGK
jgi:hypothetical protein